MFHTPWATNKGSGLASGKAANGLGPGLGGGRWVGRGPGTGLERKARSWAVPGPRRLDLRSAVNKTVEKNSKIMLEHF